MSLLVALALGVAIWAMATGRLQKLGSREVAALVIGGIGLVMLGRGKVVAALALVAAGAALWPWWRKSPGRSTMSLAEARALLGVAADADEEAIRAAYRRLIAQTHPDRGGTEELARQITLARDTALSAVISR